MSTSLFEDTRFQYKSDDHGNPLYARVCWQKNDDSRPKPIVIITHAGGLVVGSSAMIPNPQIAYLTSHNCIVVIPNYRLAPQVSATTSFADVDSAYDWSISTLPSLVSDYGIGVDTTRIAAYGHSIGGTLALHLASRGGSVIKVAAALYPCLYMSDKSSTSFQPYAKPPFGVAPGFEPSEEDWQTISTEDAQVSETALLVPGSVPAARNRWQMTLIKNGLLTSVVQPDGDFVSIDPTTRFKHVGTSWPPTLFVSPLEDDIPGCGDEYIRRAVGEMKEAGVKEVQVVPVTDSTHMFDIVPSVGTSDLGAKWLAVKAAMDFVVQRL